MFGSDQDDDLRDRIVVFTTLGCPHSAQLKKFLKSKNVVFNEVQISNYPVGFMAVDKMLKRGSPALSLPRVFSNGVYIGGFSDCHEAGVLSQLQNASKVMQLQRKDDNEQDLSKFVSKTALEQRHVSLNSVYVICYNSAQNDKQMIKIKGKKLNFKASEFITWMVSCYPHTKEREAALKLATKMKEAGFIVHYYRKEMDKPFLDDSTLWQFCSDQEVDILNNKVVAPPHLHNKIGSDIERHPGAVGFALLSHLYNIVDTHSTEKGIDFDALEKDPQWEVFMTDILELNLTSVLFNGQMTDKEKTVFYLQLYQLLRLHLIIKYRGFPTSTSAYATFVTYHSYLIQDLKFNLQTLANILWTGYFLKPKTSTKKLAETRKKGRFVADAPTEPFISHDYRLLFATLRVHNASPPLLLITEKNVDFALHWATEHYCQDVKVIGNTVICPLIFSHVHKSMNCDDKEFLQWLIQFVPEQQNMKLHSLDANKVTLQFKKHAWEESIQSSLIFDLEPSLIDSTKKVGLEKLPSEPEVPKDADDEPALPPEVMEIVDGLAANASPLLALSSFGFTSLPQKPFLPIQENVKRLVLKENLLTKLPAHFSNTFKYVYEIDLSDNKLKIIPTCFVELKFLESLNLSRNFISFIPNRFCTLRTLKNLWLQNNELEHLPLAFAQLRTLEDINLSHNNLTEIPFNFGEVAYLENLDLRNNRLTKIPDLSNLLCLEDLALANNRLTSFDFGLKGLRHLIALDLANNLIKQIPNNVSHLVYLNELSLANNQIAVVPEELCELLSLKEKLEGLDLSGNPIVNMADDIWKKGIAAIREHYKWDKLLPHVRASRGRPMEMMTAQGPNAAMGKTPIMKKQLSTRDKRSQLLKKKTNKEFSGNVLQDLRDKYSAMDSSFLLSEVTEASAQPLLAPNASPSVEAKTQGMSLGLDLSSLARSKSVESAFAKNQRDRSLIELDLAGLTIEMPSEEPMEPSCRSQRSSVRGHDNGKEGGTGGGVELQYFDFKPFYQRDFNGKAHSNFLGYVKNIGPVIISIMDYTPPDDPVKKEPEVKPRERSKSAVFAKKLKPSTEKSSLKAQAKEDGDTANNNTTSSTSTSPAQSQSKITQLNARLEKSVSRRMSVGAEHTERSKMRSTSSGGHSDRKLTARTDSKGAPEEEEPKVQVMVRTKDKDVIDYIVIDRNSKSRPKDLLRQLIENYPQFSGTSFKMVNTPELNNVIVEIEMKLMVKGYKFGLLYSRAGQSTEEEFYLNCEEGENYQEFKSWLGETITLKGWKGYTAGLDVESDMTGKHSLFTIHRSFDIMFHVATMLPFEEGEDMIQQISRKRHLGNDIVIVLFQEGDCPRFNPKTIKSFFNHVYFVIKKDEAESAKRGKTTYLVSVAYKVGVNAFLPRIPENGYLEKTDEGRDLLLTKIINSERAAYSAPGFSKALERTKETLMNNCINNATQQSVKNQSSGWA